ncbi:MAG: T9SS type A sorting domain-containing protein [Candidatus Krumholzibacteriota bacterium]|nr:T9SS type A sorting domain-containing protein [Candidatus Krumholzibacteriota bacterium]
MGRFAAFTACLCILLCTAAAPLNAQWALNGINIFTGNGYQYASEIIPDGAGGAVIVWVDGRNWQITEHDLYAQRIDEFGRALWAPDGVPVTTADTDQDKPSICTDGAGGVFVVYESEEYWLDDDIFLAHVDGDGTTLWARSIATLGGDQWNPRIVSDDAGGCILVYEDYYLTYSNLYAQRVDGDGVTKWGIEPMLVCDATQHQYEMEICSDGQGGVIIAWTDLRNFVHIYAQRVDHDGDIRWTANGTPVCQDNSLLFFPQIVADGSGGAIIAWYDQRHVSYWSAYAQRVSSTGAKLWTTDGVLLSGTLGDVYDVRLASDGEGGAIVAWEDNRSSNSNIYVQRISGNGNAGWGSSGMVICNFSGDQDTPRIVSDGAGGAIVSWRDYRSGNPDVYAQRVGHYSTIEWVLGGVSLCTDIGNQMEPRLCADGRGGMIGTWADYRDDIDVYTQRVDRFGYWGWPAGTITGVDDIAGDQGGSVRVTFDRSRLDGGGGGVVEQYSVWRRLSGEELAALLARGAQPVEIGELQNAEDPARPGAMRTESDRPVFHVTTAGGMTYGWEFLDYLEATEAPQYTYDAPTHHDSIPGDAGWHYFKVIAHAIDQARFWESPVDSGYSIDNLSPAPPSSGEGQQSYDPEGLDLSWNGSDAPDFSHYGIYKATPGSSGGLRAAADVVELLATTTETTYFDDTWRWWEGSYHIVTAVDIHGNESAGDTIRGDDITGGATPSAPAASFLDQNYPNPFNPSTTIRFGLDAPAVVTLRVYDVAGRLVRTIVDERRPAAAYAETWDGLDRHGRPAASGVYFYRLRAGDFVETKKMVLSR